MADTKLPDDSAQKHNIAQIHPPKFDFATFESKWRTIWEEQKLYQVDLRNARRPYYNRWTQWIFIQLFKAGLAERKAAPVNWCPKDKTVLADEQVINGHCERCGSIVQRRLLEQWFLKITSYAQRLLDNMHQLDWSE